MSVSLSEWAAGRLAAAGAAGLRRVPRPLRGPTGSRVVSPGRGEVLLFCSNDYLGLAAHPALRAALAEGARRYGAGAGASRLVSGERPEHAEAERALADLVQRPAALLFSSGFVANATTIAALVGRDDVIFSDRLVHASLVDGCRLSRAKVHVYSHGDPGHLETLLRAHRHEGRHALVVTDSLFSMDGDEAPLRELRSLCDRFDAWLYVDEAHALGVLGPRGRGLCVEQAVVPDVLVGTLGKALGLWGAFVAAEAQVIEWLWQRVRGFVFSTAVPPALCAAVPEAVRLSLAAEAERARLQSLAGMLREGLRARGERVLDGRSPIVPVLLGEPVEAVARSDALLLEGCFVQAIRPPTVPEGTSRLRVTVSASHMEADVRVLLTAFESSASRSAR